MWWLIRCHLRIPLISLETFILLANIIGSTCIIEMLWVHFLLPVYPKVINRRGPVEPAGTQVPIYSSGILILDSDDPINSLP